MAVRGAIFLVVLIFYQAEAIHFPGLDVLRPFSSPEVQEQAVHKLIERVFGAQYSKQFDLVVDPTLTADSDVVIIDRGQKEAIKITGASGVAVAWGVNHFLRNCCNVHVSWDGNRISLPSALPHPAIRSQHHSIGRFRYYANVCTFSYSFVWWNWTTWETHLDWMALNGINLPLASVGMESIWQRIYKNLGLTQEEIDAYFTGPAFLAWRRMGNLKGWGGPLTDNWHRNELALQKQILGRMVDLGMIPVLPTFAGHVPDAFQRLYPSANISVLRWLDFNCSYTCIRFVEPTDPLFQQIGTLFMNEIKKEFGLYHAYSADPFNEMSPRTYDSNYLNQVGKAIYSSMSVVDPDAVWVMQGWMFVVDGEWRKNNSAKTFLTSVPVGKLLILDLYSEQVPVYDSFESYYGQPFIWNVLHNFGGMLGLFGSVSKINQRLLDAKSFPNSSIVGAGITMEGIFQNYPVYQFSFDRVWSSRGQKLNEINWINHYARQRYGHYDESLRSAWHLLWTSLYNESNVPHISPLSERPSLDINADPGYDTKSLCTAWKYFVSRSEAHQSNNLFLLDLVDVTRESLMIIAGDAYHSLVKAYSTKDKESTTKYGNMLVEIFDALDKILLTHEHFLLGRWIKEARAKGTTVAESDQYEYNLRNQLTLWGPNGEILDYARKQWASLVADYYKPRWLLFVNELLESLDSGTQFSQDHFNQLAFTTVEKPFTFKKTQYPEKPVGNAVQVAKELYDKYFVDCRSAGWTNAGIQSDYAIPRVKLMKMKPIIM